MKCECECSEDRRLVEMMQHLIAPPTNPELSLQPNKSQTIVNYVREYGPVTRRIIYEDIGRLFSMPANNVAALLWQILASKSKRLVENETGEIVFTNERNP